MKLLANTVAVVCLFLTVSTSSAFLLLHNENGVKTVPNPLLSLAMAAKGFGGNASGGGFGSSSSSKSNKSDVKKKQKEIEKKYGKDIAQGTQRRIERAMAELPPHWHIATQLYQQLQNGRLVWPP